MSNENKNQAIVYLNNEIRKTAKNHKMNSNNTGIATIGGFGEVLYTNIPETGIDPEEDIYYIVLWNDGESWQCGFDVFDNPFTSAGLYIDHNGVTYTVTKIEPIADIEKRLMKLRLLGSI